MHNRSVSRLQQAAWPVLPILLLGISLSGGCAGPRPTGPAPQAPIPGYGELKETLQGLDLTPLGGRRVVIDPGHGGFFRGAIGPNGLAEADVNLGVALYLRGLLEWAGAQVWLTRSADVDFLSPADSSLAGDLAQRVDMSNTLQPDVFLSVHHNSTANSDRTVNETQTYYPLGDDGASLDLARAIHRHLVVNLQIVPASIRPGNFHVLRNATVPAILGEPAMISHPVMAGRLSLAASQRLEAEAYFLGLLDYFSGGLPAWSGAVADTVFWGGAGDTSAISWRFLTGEAADTTGAVVADGLPGPDPSYTQLALDGRPIAYRLSPDTRTVSWNIPPDLTATPHLLELRGRNLAGRATPHRRTWLMPRAGSTVEVAVTVAPGSQQGAVHWRSANGGPLPTGTLHLGNQLAFEVAPGRETWALVADLDTVWPERKAAFQTNPGSAPARPCSVQIRTLSSGQRLGLVTLDESQFEPSGGWRSRAGVDSRGPLLMLANEGPLWVEGVGIQPLISLPSGAAIGVDTDIATGTTWAATALLPGLRGKVIVLDPAGGESEVDGTGPLGVRGADLNLAVAECAAHLLRGAGAIVHLTRRDETALPLVDKVRLADQVGADLFLSIGRHDPGEARLIRFHPGSTVGSAWAAAAAQASLLLPTPIDGVADTCRVVTSTAYLLRHTACPALELRLDSPQSAAAEIRQSQPGWQRAEARTILLAVAAVSGHPEALTQPLPMAAILADLADRGGLDPARIDWVLVDGNFPWSPLPPLPTVAATPAPLYSEREPHLPDLLPQHFLEVHASDQWQLWLVSRWQDGRQDGWQSVQLLAGQTATQ